MGFASHPESYYIPSSITGLLFIRFPHTQDCTDQHNDDNDDRKENDARGAGRNRDRGRDRGRFQRWRKDGLVLYLNGCGCDEGSRAGRIKSKQSDSQGGCHYQGKDYTEKRTRDVERIHLVRKYIRIPRSRKYVIANRTERRWNEAIPKTVGR